MKIGNEALDELVNLKKAVKPMLDRIAEIEPECKKRGTFVTSEYAVVVSECQRIGMASYDKCAAIIGKDRLFVLGLVSTSQFKVVRVSKRDFTHPRKDV